MPQAPRDGGVDPDALSELYLKAHNDCIANRPEDLQVGLHVCRGNFSKSMHFSEGPREKTPSASSPRSTTTPSPRARQPAGNNVVLGVATTKDPALEDAE
ncbi:Uncharacterized protein YxjH [Tolypocladium paradoxum]|uniref:Uncharacterized protein YxjH n=1 Tax=Tolypocladium paradoxum TaxID=94208 RepID=A0A2S4KPU5_9HYPO|nr:Uncharacterized protein YxjH [Tolypocladium paradoxum]